MPKSNDKRCDECDSYGKLYVVGGDVLFATCNNLKSKMYRKIIYGEETCKLHKLARWKQ